MAVNPGSFADLGKEAKEDLFKSKDFNTKDQLSFTTTSTSGVKAISKLTREDGGKVTGQLEFKFPKHKTSGVEGSATFDNKGKTKLSIASADKFVPGLKTTLAAEIVQSDQSAKRDLILTTEYKREHLHETLKVTVPVTPSGPNFGATSVNAQTVVGLEGRGLALGVEADYSVGESSLKALNVNAQYKQGNFTLNGFSRQTLGSKPGHVCGATYYMKVPNSVFSGTEVAGELEYDTLKSTDNVTVSLASGFDINDTTRFNVKADSRGRSMGIFTHNVNKNFKVRVGGEIQAETLVFSKSFVEVSFTD